MDLGLTGRVALVTGGSQGIGQAIAEALGREGAAVAVTFRTQEDLARATAARICAAGGAAAAVPLDLGSRSSIEAAIDAVSSRWGRLDVLVNNAVDWGPRTLSAPIAFDEQPVAEWAPLLTANIAGAAMAIHRAVPLMKTRGWGRVVNISSSVVESGIAGTAWYSSAKSALHGLTRSLAKELEPSGILINVVMPGPTRTPRVERLYPGLVRAQGSARPGQRLLAPHETASLVVYLSSAANTAVTGQLIAVTGAIVPPAVPLRPAASPARVGLTDESTRSGAQPALRALDGSSTDRSRRTP